MTTAQYRRLLLALIIPLLLLGAWLGEDEILLPQHSQTLCQVMQDRSYSCNTLQTRGIGTVLQKQHEEGGVWVSHFARLPDDFVADVITEPMNELSFTDGVRKETPVGGGVQKHLHVSNSHGAGMPGGSCSLNRSDDHVWYLQCGTNDANFFHEAFRITDPVLDARYESLLMQAREGTARAEQTGRIYFWISVFTPFAAFIALSLACWIVLRAYRYVQGTPTESHADA